MRYFAELDEKNTVKRIICAEKEFVDSGKEGNASKFVETFQGDNFAGIGYTYDTPSGIFIPPSPYPSWIFNFKTSRWEAPIKVPSPNPGFIWIWNEAKLSWDAWDEKNK